MPKLPKVRSGERTRTVMLTGLDIWCAAHWRAVRNERLLEARMRSGESRGFAVQAARRAQRYFLSHLDSAGRS